MVTGPLESNSRVITTSWLFTCFMDTSHLLVELVTVATPIFGRLKNDANFCRIFVGDLHCYMGLASYFLGMLCHLVNLQQFLNLYCRSSPLFLGKNPIDVVSVNRLKQMLILCKTDQLDYRMLSVLE